MAGKYNIYSSQLGDTAYFAQGVVTPVGKTFFIFLFNAVKESLKWENEGTLMQIAYSSKDPQTDVSSYINNTFFIGGNVGNEFMTKYKEYKLSHSSGGQKNRRSKSSKKIKNKNKRSKKYKSLRIIKQ